jgi:hypothetical protein
LNFLTEHLNIVGNRARGFSAAAIADHRDREIAVETAATTKRNMDIGSLRESPSRRR